MSTREKTKKDVDRLEKKTNLHEIVLHNDDVNSFDFVIDALIDVCEHTSLQAQQCTILVHYKGKASVKKGEFKDLKSRCTKLLDLGLSAEIV